MDRRLRPSGLEHHRYWLRGGLVHASTCSVRFGSVTGTDLSDELLAVAKSKQPEVEFVAGDFMALDFKRAPFDVAVSLEVLSHVADQPAFIAKISGLLKTGGHFMIATQNEPILKNYNRKIPAPAHGQLRKWVDRDELRALLLPHFDVLELRAVTPIADHGVMRILASPKLNRLMRRLVGNAYQNFLERCGFGWTLMALARKR